ncbi:MAG: GNAT family N-acetyltransferase [candidate division WOR-3 bacterium]|nr:MAG: GNAT family N-acetyltransferase [candidate division WOR-3 bacterium]
MEGMIHIRPYVEGQDDETVVNIRNASSADAPDFVTQTVKQFRIARKSPNWTAVGIYIAEFDRTPVGVATGFVDARRHEPYGSMGGPSVLPEYRRQGIGTALVNRALDYLRSKGMERARTGCGDWNKRAQAFLGKLGFKPIRRFSLMRRPLGGLPSGIGENTDIAIEEHGTTDEDVGLITRLANAAFREHFGHRDGTVEEIAFWMRNAEKMGYVIRRTLARLDGEPVGFLVHGIDPRENKELGTRRGALWSVGVLKEFRNRGIAKRLMLDGMEWLVGQGMDEVELGVDDENVTQARTLYERLGFNLVRSSLTYERSVG